MKKTNIELERIIIEEYISGFSCTQIGTKYNMSNTTIFNILKRNNITMRTKGGLYKLPEKAICDYYSIKHKTLKEISDMYNCSIETIRNIIIKNNIEIINRLHRYNPNLNEDYFENIDDEFKAYILGFIIADGSISLPDPKNHKPNPVLRIQVAYKDIEILEIFKYKIGLKSKLIYDKKRDLISINISSKKIVDDLAKYGIVNNKTFKTFLPTNIDDKFYPHLIRGIFDGDGWISIYKNNAKNKYHSTFGICGNLKLIEDLKFFFESHCNVNKIKITQKAKDNSNFASIMYKSKQNILDICNFLYKDSQYYLKRKYEKYEIIKNNYEIIPS